MSFGISDKSCDVVRREQSVGKYTWRGKAIAGSTLPLGCYGAQDTNGRLAIDSAESDICSKWLDMSDIVTPDMSKTQLTDLATKIASQESPCAFDLTRPLD